MNTVKFYNQILINGESQVDNGISKMESVEDVIKDMRATGYQNASTIFDRNIKFVQKALNGETIKTRGLVAKIKLDRQAATRTLDFLPEPFCVWKYYIDIKSERTGETVKAVYYFCSRKYDVFNLHREKMRDMITKISYLNLSLWSDLFEESVDNYWLYMADDSEYEEKVDIVKDDFETYDTLRALKSEFMDEIVKFADENDKIYYDDFVKIMNKYKFNADFEMFKADFIMQVIEIFKFKEITNEKAYVKEK